MNGQDVTAEACVWCGRPAVGEVEVRPAAYHWLGPVDPIIGDRGAYRQLGRAAVRVPVCDEHRQITIGQLPPVGVPRQRTATAVEQLTLFPVTADERLLHAIYRQTGP